MNKLGDLPMGKITLNDSEKEQSSVLGDLPMGKVQLEEPVKTVSEESLSDLPMGKVQVDNIEEPVETVTEVIKVEQEEENLGDLPMGKVGIGDVHPFSDIDMSITNSEGVSENSVDSDIKKKNGLAEAMTEKSWGILINIVALILLAVGYFCLSNFLLVNYLSGKVITVLNVVVTFSVLVLIVIENILFIKSLDREDK